MESSIAVFLSRQLARELLPTSMCVFCVLGSPRFGICWHGVAGSDDASPPRCPAASSLCFLSPRSLRSLPAFATATQKTQHPPWGSNPRPQG